MHELILWAGFLGAWLLVAGPVYQAVLELEAEEFERESFNAVAAAVPVPDRVSFWWWLVPPVHLYLSSRRRTRWQELVVAELPAEQYEALDAFMRKARGWILVGTGGLLIACKETYELVEGNEWPIWLFWVLLVAMGFCSLGNAARLSARDGRSTDSRWAAREPAASRRRGQ